MLGVVSTVRKEGGDCLTVAFGVALTRQGPHGGSSQDWIWVAS